MVFHTERLARATESSRQKGPPLLVSLLSSRSWYILLFLKIEQSGFQFQVLENVGLHLEQVGISTAFVLTWSDLSQSWGQQTLEPDNDSNVEAPTKLRVDQRPAMLSLWTLPNLGCWPIGQTCQNISLSFLSYNKAVAVGVNRRFGFPQCIGQLQGYWNPSLLCKEAHTQRLQKAWRNEKWSK